MNKNTTTPISVRMSTQERKGLDAVAQHLDRDRSYVINQAVKNYLELHAWQVAHIREGVEQADKGTFASAGMVDKLLR